jgi:hypothetical protein
MKIFGNGRILSIVFYLLCNLYASSHVSRLMNGSFTDVFPKVAESIDFSVVYRLAKEIFSLTKQNGTASWSRSSNNTSIINKSKLNSLIRLFEEKHTSSPPIRSQNDRLFFLKTHKTGSSTVSTILWRSLCLFSNQPDTNCFLPTKENSGRMWSEKDQKALEQTTGTNGSFLPFEIWNAHVKVNFFESLVDSSGLRGKLENTFSEFMFQKILPRPTHFLSTIRRPSCRFESAFHWYELSPASAGIDLPISNKNQQPQRELESSGQVQSSTKENLFGKFLEFFQFRKEKKTKSTKRKKNRLNSEKLGSSNVRSSNNALLLKEFVEAIARKIVDRVESHPELRSFSLGTLSLSSTGTNLILKQIIDEILQEYEKKWKFRSGFHSMTKELLGQNQFAQNPSQTALSQNRFEYYYSILLYSLLSSPSDPRLPKFLLIDIDNFQSSLILLKHFISPFLVKNGLHSQHQNLLLYYFNQKTQNYQKLSNVLSPTVAELYYLFLDSLQYYDSFLYELNKELMDQQISQQSLKFERELREFSEEISVFQESCRSIQSNQTTVKSLVEEDDLKILQSVLQSYLLEGKETLSKVSELEWQSLCKLYSLDNYDYVQLFHKLLSLKGKKTN